MLKEKNVLNGVSQNAFLERSEWTLCAVPDNPGRGPIKKAEMNPFPWWPCGLASDTRCAVVEKINFYLAKIKLYLAMHHFLSIFLWHHPCR